jgi:septum site-determining protein MinC
MENRMTILSQSMQEKIITTVITIQSSKAEYLESMISQSNPTTECIYTIIDLSAISSLESPSWFRNLRSFMRQHNMTLIGVRNPQLNLEICKSLKIPVIEPQEETHASWANQSTAPVVQAGNTTIDGPIRSGQQVYAEQGSLIINGNISAGAEVAANQDVHIYGSCHGKILAGVSGKEDSRIYIKVGFPELVSIAGITLHSEDIKPITQDTMFLITNGQLSQHLL